MEKAETEDLRITQHVVIQEVYGLAELQPGDSDLRLSS